MFEWIGIGRYVSGNRFLHKMDPRCKLIMVFMFVCLIAFTPSVWMMAVHAAAASTAMFSARIPISIVWRYSKGILLIASVAALFQLVSHGGGDTVGSPGLFSISEDGMEQALLVFGRIMLLIVSVSILTLTTSSSDLAYGMAAVLYPLRVFGIPNERFAFLIILSLRFLPVFQREIHHIVMAHKARLGGLRRSGLFAFIPQLASFFVFAFAHMYRRAEGLSAGLAARGYIMDAERIRRRTYRTGWRDAVGLFIVVAQYIVTFV